MNRYRMLWVGVAVLTIALAAQATMYVTAKPEGTAHAVWAFQPKNFGDVVNKATVVVEAQVVAVNKGPDIIIPVAAEPSGKVVIPTQHITVKVLAADKGSVAIGQQLTVFHTGGETNIPTAPPAGASKNDPNAQPPEPVQVGVLMLDDDPAYNVGERYFLLMEPGPTGTLRPVSPEGRYHINSDGTLGAVSGSDVAKSISGRTVQDALASTKGSSNLTWQRNGEVRAIVSKPGVEVGRVALDAQVQPARLEFLGWWFATSASTPSTPMTRP